MVAVNISEELRDRSSEGDCVRQETSLKTINQVLISLTRGHDKESAVYSLTGQKVGKGLRGSPPTEGGR